MIAPLTLYITRQYDLDDLFDLHLFDNQRNFLHSPLLVLFLLIGSWAQMFLMGLDLVRRRKVLDLALIGVVSDEKGIMFRVCRLFGFVHRT